ncbi:MAG: hypothetical protein FK733_01865 [Asgard group archaeon]|nr:hypothetical protein [Asgard group archaeon]
MLFEFPQEKRAELLPLFQDVDYLEAIVLGTLTSDLGKVFVDNINDPKNAIFVYEAMKLVVLGGSGEGEVEVLISKIPNVAGILCSNEKWRLVIKEHFGEKLN